MSNPFINRRNTKNRRRGDSPIINTVQGEFIRIADFDTFYWHTPSPGVGADRWNDISDSQLVVGAMNPWNHSDASNYPQSGGMLGSVIPPRTPTRSVMGFDLTGVPTAGSIVEATLSLTVADSQFWTRYEGTAQQTQNPLVERRKNDLLRRFYMIDYLSPVSLDFDGTGFDGWSNNTRRTYNGNPSANYGDVDYGSQRAYPYEADPSDLSRTAWHNIIYEKCHKLYEAGWRAFHFHFPFGNLTHSWMLTPLIQMQTYTDTSNPARSPARIKGFTQAIKGLLDGTLVPGNGRIPMDEPSDVHLYLTAASGYPTYRNKALQYWLSLGTTDAERDSRFMEKLDEFVEYIKSMKSDKGILSVTLDVGGRSATPKSIEVYRTAPGYRSDVLELADWYVSRKLIAAGIPVNAEARPEKRLTRSPFGGTTVETPVESEWRDFTSDASYFWYSDPDTASSVGDLGFDAYVRNDECEWTHIGCGFGGPLHSATRHPWGHSTVVSHGGTAVDAPWYLNGTSAVYSPYDAVQQLYNAADAHLNYLSSASPSEEWETKKRNKAEFVTIGIVPQLLLPHAIVQPGRTTNEYAWWNSNGIPNPNVLIMPKFNPQTFLANPRTYSGSAYWTGEWTGQGTPSLPADINGDGIVDAADLSTLLGNWGTSDPASDIDGDGNVGASDLSSILANWGVNSVQFGSSGSIAWFNTNVRGVYANSRTTFMNAVQDLALNYAPRNSGVPKTAYGDDPYYLNIIDPSLREEIDEGSGPVQPSGFERSLDYEVWAASWNPAASIFPMPSPAEGLPAIVPSVNLYAQYAQFRNPNNPSVVPLLSQAVEDLSKIPAGRRVVMPHFWLDDSISSQILKHEYYKPTADGTDYVGPAGTARFLSPWQEINTEDGRRTFSEFLVALSEAGGMFDYICDDHESSGSFNLGSYFTTTGNAPNNFVPPPDARRTAAIVADPRFTGYISRTSGKSFKDEFMENYSLFVPNASSDYTQILAPFTNVTSATDYKAPWVIGQQPVMWAWQGALNSLMHGDLYLKRMVDPVRQLPQYSNVRLFAYSVYAKKTDNDVLSDPDLNTHLSHRRFFPNVNFAPELYGKVADSLMNLGYNPNLSPGDIARTRWGGGTRVGGGSNQGKAFVAFVKDAQIMRIAARGVPEGEDIQIAPWISTPSAVAASSYIHDPRYWKEMVFHACLCGAQFFNVFVNEFGEYDARFNQIQDVLDEWKELSGNSKARLADDNLIDIVDAVTNCLVTGGMLLSGPKAGLYLWRISVPFEIVDSSGSTYLTRNGSNDEIPQSITIPSTTRGTWVLTTTSVPPSYTASASPGFGGPLS
jgi:hypothetical protein